MKLFKVISSSGELSRRKSIDAIQEAMVTVNGKLILDPFIEVEAKDDIRLDDKKINYNTDLTTILLNKPKGYICLLYTSPSPRDTALSRMPSSA